jgi:hypothetical protein
MLYTRLCIVLLLLFGNCSQPQPSGWRYPENPAVSDTHGQPRDTTTLYFPAADSIPASYVLPEKRAEMFPVQQKFTCSFEFKYSSYCLVYFGAPLLSNYYLDADTYRFLWMRSFHRPVLLTLERTTTGATLRTQQLSKFPSFDNYDLPDPDQPGLSAKDRDRILRMQAFTRADTSWSRRVRLGKQRAFLLPETRANLSREQWNQFEKLLQQAQVWQLPSCQPVSESDGALWLLEAHQAERYHLVSRHSPQKNDAFRRACEYLIDLSSVRNEERY